MWAKMLLAFAGIIIVSCTSAEYDFAKYCQLVKTGTKLASLISCKTYYTCSASGQPIQDTCSGATVFDKDSQSCISEINSNCFRDSADPCENRDTFFAPSTHGCNLWNYCLNGKVAYSGSCPAGQKFYAEEGRCVYGECSKEGKSTTDIENICDIMPNNEFFGDFESCNSWHKCIALTNKAGKCTGSLVYDTKTGMCLNDDGSMCQRTENIVINSGGGPPPAADCSGGTNVTIVGDTQMCSVYYKCESVQLGNTPKTYQWVEYKCTHQYFDVISQQCTDRLVARAYPGCNRCQFTMASTYWVNDFDAACTEYNTCKNGQLLSNGHNSCGNGYYFNEADQYCMPGVVSLDNYVEAHGTCQKYKCDENRICTLDVAPETRTTDSPVTKSPTTESSATEAPTTKSPATEAPTTKSPATEAPTTKSPATELPTTEKTVSETPSA